MPVSNSLFVDDLPSDAGADAPLVVLVHGTMDRHSSFAKVRSRLMPTCHVLSYDRRGYGASRDAPPPARNLEDHLADLETVVAGRPCTLAGHSYGGTLTLAFADRHPELTRAVLAYEPPLPWREEWPNRYGPEEAPFARMSSEEAAEAFVRRIVGEDRYERLPLRTREEIVRDGDALVAELTAIRNDPAPFDPGTIVVPVLLARGERSARHHVDGTDWLLAHLPNATLEIVPGAGHLGHQSHPSEFAALVLQAVAAGADAS